MMWSCKNAALVFTSVVAAGQPLTVDEIVEYSGLTEKEVLAVIPEVLKVSGWCVETECNYHKSKRNSGISSVDVVGEKPSK